MHAENSYLRVLQIKLDTLQENINSKVNISEYKVKEIINYFEMLDRLRDTLSLNDLHILEKEINRFQSIYNKTKKKNFKTKIFWRLLIAVPAFITAGIITKNFYPFYLLIDYFVASICDKTLKLIKINTFPKNAKKYLKDLTEIENNIKKQINSFNKTNDLQDVKVEEITNDKVEEKELFKLVNSLNEDVSSLYESSNSSSDNDWPLGLIYNIIAKVSYLKINLNNLTDEEIKKFKNSLDELLNIYDTELFGPQVCIAIIGFGMTFLGVLFSVLFSTWWIAIILFLITPLFLKFKVYPYLKEDIRGEAFKKFGENKKSIKKLNKELAKMLKRKNINQMEETKEIPEQKHVEVQEDTAQKEKSLSIEELISHTESIIMLLKNEEENVYRKKVYDILQTYRQDLDNAKGMSNNLKEDYLNMSLRQLKKELTKIENEILTKYNTNINEQKEKMADTLFNDFNQNKYLNEVSLLALMKSLNDLLPNTDLILSLNIKDRFAKCFYDTLSNLHKDNTLIDNIDDIYLDRIIIYGENLINEYENNLYILEYRDKLYKLKNNLNKRDYLKYLYQFLTTTNILKKETLGNDNKVIFYTM